ncbi:hypothetical protein HPB48_000194 [Haemaphysalis longicornis]|uniref:Uncharacterized protein n=1 Tax=Haemaphysalis longicornis TaxID=44386 RepID=A0A9J6GRM1_HAELO|nr:hypothetical protein HPB48_000194 [Haemaphysalis longicornis]
MEDDCCKAGDITYTNPSEDCESGPTGTIRLGCLPKSTASASYRKDVRKLPVSVRRPVCTAFKSGTIRAHTCDNTDLQRIECLGVAETPPHAPDRYQRIFHVIPTTPTSLEAIPHQATINSSHILIEVPGRPSLGLRCYHAGHYRNNSSTPLCHACRAYVNDQTSCTQSYASRAKQRTPAWNFEQYINAGDMAGLNSSEGPGAAAHRPPPLPASPHVPSPPVNTAPNAHAERGNGNETQQPPTPEAGISADRTVETKGTEENASSVDDVGPLIPEATDRQKEPQRGRPNIRKRAAAAQKPSKEKEEPPAMPGASRETVRPFQPDECTKKHLPGSRLFQSPPIQKKCFTPYALGSDHFIAETTLNYMHHLCSHSDNAPRLLDWDRLRAECQSLPRRPWSTTLINGPPNYYRRRKMQLPPLSPHHRPSM